MTLTKEQVADGHVITGIEAGTWKMSALETALFKLAGADGKLWPFDVTRVRPVDGGDDYWVTVERAAG